MYIKMYDRLDKHTHIHCESTIHMRIYTYNFQCVYVVSFERFCGFINIHTYIERIFLVLSNEIHIQIYMYVYLMYICGNESLFCKVLRIMFFMHMFFRDLSLFLNILK